MAHSHFLKTTIILPVSDIYDTIDSYGKALGFQSRYVHGNGRRGEAEDFANYAIMNRDSVEVHFILDEGGAVWTRAGTRASTTCDVFPGYAASRSPAKRSGPAGLSGTSQCGA